jgi:hypothetical protein
VRDLAHREILARGAPVTPLAAGSKASPAAQTQRAWCAAQRGADVMSQIDILLSINAERWPEAAAPAQWQAVALAELDTSRSPRLVSRLAELARHTCAGLAFQVALELGGIDGEPAGDALAGILLDHPDDPWVRAAVLTGATRHGGALLAALAAQSKGVLGRDEAMKGVLASAIASADRDAALRLLSLITDVPNEKWVESWRLDAAAQLLPRFVADGAPRQSGRWRGRAAGRGATRDPW